MDYIYKIENLVNHKVYIGNTNNPERRKQEHFTHLNTGTHSVPLLQEEYNLYGKENFKFEVLYVAPDGVELKSTKMELAFMEVYKSYDASKGYNYQDNLFKSGIPDAELKLKEIPKGSILAKISKHAKERGISIHELEKRAKLGNGTIRKWKTFEPSVTNLKKVAETLNISYLTLLE